MKKHFFIFYFLLLIFNFSFSQNVGIGTAIPNERLDVNGNINVTGTIKANGVDGTSNQVLMKNNSGILAWSDMCQYQNFVSLTLTTASTWIVPSGVTKILVEVWGAGGGGNVFCGGGGGGYIKGHFTVVPGAVVSYIAGTGGAGAGNATAPNGGNSTSSVGSVTLRAFGGGGAFYSSTVAGFVGNGGISDALGGFINYISLKGEQGESVKKKFFQFNATQFYEIGEAGLGGNAANTNNTGGGKGSNYIYNNTSLSLVLQSLGWGSSMPGGGGGSGYLYLGGSTGGTAGSNGLVVINY